MKNVSLYGPFFWLRKMVLYLLVLAVGLGLVVYFAVNSPLVIKKVADRFAPDYNISYSNIYGNALTGIEIDDLAYNKDLLAKHITFKWNPSGLVHKTIIVNRLEVEKANVDNIKTLISSFSSEDNESESTEPLDITVRVDYLFIDLESFVEQGIAISNVVLDTKDVEYRSDSISVGTFDLQVDSNVTDIMLHASLADGKVIIKELNIKDIDTLALQTLFLSESHDSNASAESNESHSVSAAENNNSQTATPNPLIPTYLVIEKMQTNVLPLKYDPLKVKHLVLTVSDALFDLQKLVLNKAKVDFNASTNLSEGSYKAEVKENHLMGKLRLIPSKELFDLYDLPLSKAAIGDIVIDLNASEEQVVADLNMRIKQLLKVEDNASKDAFNVDIDTLHSHVVYDVKEGELKVNSKIILSTPYAKDISVTNIFMLDENISYSGELALEQVIGIDKKFTKALNNLHISYTGDGESINTDILSENLQGTFTSADFKKATFHLETIEAMALNQFVELPAELNGSKANIIIDAPIRFDANSSLLAQVKIASNVVNVDAELSYKDLLQVKSVIEIPEKSLLRPYSKELKWDSINPITTEIKLLDGAVDFILKAGTLGAKAHYVLESTKVDAKITLDGLEVDISGIAEQKLNINTNINAMPVLIESIQSIYTLENLPVVKGSADLSLVVSELKNINLIVTSPKIIYQPDDKTVHVVNDIDVELSMNESEVVLKRYTLTYQKQKLFSTKPSRVLFKDENITIAPLWLNDQLKVTGEYNLKTKKGNIDASADKLHIAHEIIDLDSNIDIKTVLDVNKTSINGKVILLGGNIHYDMSQKSFATDSDIIIVQNMKDEEPSAFMENLSASVQIETKKPLVYKKGDINIKAKVDLGIHKAEHSELLVLGTVELVKGGSYMFEGKRFVLKKSNVYFTGNLNKPLLEISVTYKSLNYLITIMITGTQDVPNINFSSLPHLSKEEILSVILFDSESRAGTNSGADMMKMMGGAMAKSALSNMGVQLDHLVLGDGNSIEVGKKLTDDITIIYVNDIVSSVKLKYEHEKRTESVIGVSEESQSYDIIYKRDF